ncbi:MAG TPA: RidA family protein [Candidatus Angelobacter sp.]|nr:RidA family protein [Candidatus Angelobacter sp.]
MKQSVMTAVLVVAVLAMAPAATSGRKYIVLKRPAASTAPFSEGVLQGDTLYISGHIGIDPATGKPGSTPEQEARLVMESFKRTVEAGGMTMDDVVSVTVFCSDVSHYQAFNDVYRTYFHQNYPARAFIGSGKLLFDARFEVQGIALKRSGS